MRNELDNLLDHGWVHPKRKDEGYDYLSAEGAQILQVKRFSGSTRDLHAALLQLALFLGARPDVARAYLVAQMPRMTKERAQHEWERVQSVLRPNIAERLALIAVGRDTVTIRPEDTQTRRLAALVREALRPTEQQRTRPEQRPSAKFFEVWKVLLGAWLDKEGPLQVGEVVARAGCSYPTVAKALDCLRDRQEIERDSSRSVRLRAFPRRTLQEMLVLAETLRQPMRFVDATGRRPELQNLLRRLQLKKPPRVALGGALAAQHYDPHFDLHGLPRVDVVMHAPVDLSWVRDVDPALRQTAHDEPAPVLVVHALNRPEPRFIETDEYELPIADAVETLLDLYELRLNEQAEDLVRTLRGEGTKA